MIISHKEMDEKDFIDDVICNNCGRSCMADGDASPEGLIEATVRGGWASSLGDRDSFTFSICGRCLARAMIAFKIPPEYSSADDQMTYPEWVEFAKEHVLKRK